MLKDLGWFILKDNLFVNCLYYLVYRFLIKNGRLKSMDEKDEKYLENHPAYTGFDFNSETSKEFVVKNSDAFEKNKGVALKGYTSGTSNTPLLVYRSISSVIYDELSLRAHWYSVGVGCNPKIATLRGDNLFHGDYDGDIYWKKMPFTRRLIMSSFHLNENTIKAYLSALEREKPEIILAYPSAILTMAKFAHSIGWTPNWNFKGVFTSGESFSNEQQKQVKKVFKNVFDHYGQAERVSRLQQCHQGNYHFVEWYSKVEVIEKNATHSTVLGTNFRNRAMPLYRYNAGDLVSNEPENQTPCLCGNKSKYVSEVIGRVGAELSLNNGSTISTPALSLLFYGISNISEAQVVQRLDKSVEVRYSTISGVIDAVVEKELLNSFESRLGKSMNISVNYYSVIERTSAGKLLPLIVEQT